MTKPQKPRLGRGLASLVSMTEIELQNELPPPPAPHQSATQAHPSSQIELPIDSIRPNPHQPRKTMNEATLREMAASIRATGIIQPIVVRQTADGYELIAGERRLRAAKLADMQTIPAIVRDVDSLTQAQMSLIENIHREDLNPIERASAYQTLARQLGLTQEQLAARLGEDRSTIAHHLRLLELAEPVREMVRDGTLSLGHAKVIAAVPDILAQKNLADLTLAQGLSVRNLERIVADAPTSPAPPRRSAPAPSPHIQELETTITRQLGLRAQVRSASKGKGRLILHYTSLDQFDQLMERLRIKTDDD